MAIVTGLDQHRAQITADWLDTDTGEVSRARVSPGHRVSVRQFLAADLDAPPASPSPARPTQRWCLRTRDLEGACSVTTRSRDDCAVGLPGSPPAPPPFDRGASRVPRIYRADDRP
jgi:hypothetical protein